VAFPLVVEVDAARPAADLAPVDFEVDVAPLPHLPLLVRHPEAGAEVGVDEVAEAAAVTAADAADREVHQPRADRESGDVDEGDAAELRNELVEVDRPVVAERR